MLGRERWWNQNGGQESGPTSLGFFFLHTPLSIRLLHSRCPTHTHTLRPDSAARRSLFSSETEANTNVRQPWPRLMASGSAHYKSRIRNTTPRRRAERELILPSWMTTTWQQCCVRDSLLGGGGGRGGGIWKRQRKPAVVVKNDWGRAKWGEAVSYGFTPAVFPRLYSWDSVRP